MLQDQIIKNEYGEQFDSAVVEIYRIKPKYVKTIIDEPEFELIDGEWVQDTDIEGGTSQVENLLAGGMFKVRYWSQLQLKIDGNKARSFKSSTGGEWFSVEFDEDDRAMFTNGYSENSTENQKLNALLVSKLKADPSVFIGG